MKGNKSTYFLQVDEIDHLTLRYTDYGENLNKKKAAEMIHFYSFAYEEVKKNLSGYALDYASLYSKSEEELYEILVIIRNVIISKTVSSLLPEPSPK